MRHLRSHIDGFAQPGLPGVPPAEGVGARQGIGRGPGGGGRYPKICTPPNFQIQNPPPPDPRFKELEAIGLPGAWLRLARQIGFDSFLEVWRTISEDESVRHDGGRRMPKLREFDAYRRYQRNQYIRTLARMNVPPPTVKKLVEKNLGEVLSINLIQSVMRNA